MNFGPGWAWVLLGILAVVGFIAAIIWIVQGIIWLFNHIQIV